MIYCVEDDAGIRSLVVYTLQNSGFEACGFEEGAALWSALEERLPELILLDLMLPGEDGITILQKLRRDPRTASVPVIITTAKNGEYDKVLGLDSGADDYVAKPFGMMELLSRIKAVLRRTSREEPCRKMAVGELLMDDEAHVVSVEGKRIELTLKEYELLKLLLQNQQR